MAKRNNARQEKRAEQVSQVMRDTAAPIIAAIEQGLADPAGWSAPWHGADPDAFTPYNPVTEHYYTAGNALVLAMVSVQTGAASHWATFQQWRSLSKHSTECNRTATNAGTRKERRPDCGDACSIVSVRRGETLAGRILRPATAKVENKETGETETKVFGFAAHAVFHAGQVDGYDMPAPEPIAHDYDDDERADIDHAYAWAASVGARVEESATAGASYSPTLDRVMMPDRDRFTSAHGCWSTMAHELTHWTGHSSRLDRKLANKFGDDAYAAEELIAELGAAFTLAKIGRSSEPREDHAQYLASWLRVLKADARHLWTAAGHAERAGTYVVEHAALPAHRGELVPA